MLQQIILVLLLAVFIGCSSTNNQQSDIEDTASIEDSSEETLDENDLLGEEVADDTSSEENVDEDLEQEIADSGLEDETNVDGQELADLDAGDSDEAMLQEPVAEASPSPNTDESFNQESEDFFENNTTGVAAAAPTNSSGPTANVTKLDFLANQNGGTIVISTDAPVTYTTRSNPDTKQFVIEIPNANLPKKFQRPYNTNEFKGAIGLFQGYQNSSGNVARFVVQLDQDNEPLVQQEGNNIMIIASGAGASMATAETDMATPPAEVAATTESNGETPAATSASTGPGEQALGGGSIEDILSGNTEFYGRRINIEVKDWDIRDVFDFIAEQSGLNIVLAEEVQGKISLKLREVPWDQALFVVMQSKQLGYKRQGNIVRVAPLISLRAETDAAKQVLDSQKMLQPLQVKIIPVSYARAKELDNQVKDFLTPGRGKSKADERTNSLVVTDIPDVIEKVSKLIQSLDTETPQVLIEAKIVEAKEAFSRNIGVNWMGNGGARTLGNLNNKSVSGTGGIGLDLNNFFSAVTFGKAGSDFIASFGLLEKEDLLKVLSSPRIMGLNNETSKIEQTSEIPIPKAENINGVVTTTITYIPVSLILEVTPQITSQGSVIMGLKLTREFVGALEGDGRPIFKRKANTTVVVNNGETAVIGGIYQSDQRNLDTGVPLLHKIPILGYLFKNESRDLEKNELMMFVTPRIMNLEKAFASDKSEEEIIEQQSDFL